MADAQRSDGTPEKARKQDGAGHLEPTYGSESDRGNAEPAASAAPAPEHAARTIPGTDGPIEIVEDSGTAAGELKR